MRAAWFSSLIFFDTSPHLSSMLILNSTVHLNSFIFIYPLFLPPLAPAITRSVHINIWSQATIQFHTFSLMCDIFFVLPCVSIPITETQANNHSFKNIHNTKRRAVIPNKNLTWFNTETVQKWLSWQERSDNLLDYSFRLICYIYLNHYSRSIVCRTVPVRSSALCHREAGRWRDPGLRFFSISIYILCRTLLNA
jgi:hypothetical protein